MKEKPVVGTALRYQNKWASINFSLSFSVKNNPTIEYKKERKKCFPT